MSDKVQKIKKEIERRIDLYSIAEKDDSTFSRMGELSSLIDFIDSLPEEPFDYTNVNIKPKDFGELPQTIEQAAVQAHIELEEGNGLSFVNTFSKGAKWQKQQMKEILQTEYEKGRFDMREEMMKALVNSEIVKDIHNQLSVKSEPLNDTFRDIKFGDKVKIIIVKEEQQ